MHIAFFDFKKLTTRLSLFYFGSHRIGREVMPFDSEREEQMSIKLIKLPYAFGAPRSPLHVETNPRVSLRAAS